MIRGSCLCQKIRFTIEQSLQDISYCHCSMCRKASGAAFAAYGSTEIPRFKWTRGNNLLRRFEVSHQLSKYFCQNCGSTMVTHHILEPAVYHISLGCIDGAANLKPLYHQFIDSGANWYEPQDDLPKYPAWPEID